MFRFAAAAAIGFACVAPIYKFAHAQNTSFDFSEMMDYTRRMQFLPTFSAK
jgi:hypothetical protein